jgi:hypothetical protein
LLTLSGRPAKMGGLSCPESEKFKRNKPETKNNNPDETDFAASFIIIEIKWPLK